MKKILMALIIILLLTGCNRIEENPNNKEEQPVEKEENIKENNSNNKDNEYNEEKDKIEKILNNMSIEEKIGQLYLVRCPLKEDIDYYLSMKPGGFIMFGRDFANKTREEVIENINYYQNNSKIPMIIGVDEEGGTVVRVSSNHLLHKERFKSPQELYKLGGFEEIYEDAVTKSKLLLELGINLNLAPVADVSVNSNDFIYDRAFGKDAEETSEYIRTVIRAMKESKISGTLKHFPGYGNNADTHIGSAYDTRPYENFVNSDFIPFVAGIESDVETILVSHNVVESIDPNLPSSLSKKVIDILRYELKFNGIIITDDLSMGAITELNADSEPEVLAVEAGNDMLIVTDFETSYNKLLNAVKEGKISEERINESVMRILLWKYNKMI